jgi:hypothetical protein
MTTCPKTQPKHMSSIRPFQPPIQPSIVIMLSLLCNDDSGDENDEEEGEERRRRDRAFSLPNLSEWALEVTSHHREVYYPIYTYQLVYRH